MGLSEVTNAANHIKARTDKTQQKGKCRLCGDRDETIKHIISECSKLARKEYKTRHDWVGKVIHWEMCKKFKFDHVLYRHLQHHNDTIIKQTQGQRRKKDFFNNIFLPLSLLQGFERVVQGLHVRGCWRSNINFRFWPPCYDRHVVSFLFSWCWGQLHRGFPRTPSVGCGFPYHIWSLLSGTLLATALAPNSTQLYNNSTPTRSPTGSLKSNV